MTRIVLDTSALVSAVISPTGPNANVFDLIERGDIRAYITDSVLAEYHAVFEHDHLRHLNKRRIALLRGLIERAAILVKTPGRLRLSPDEADNRVYECALAAKADYIVTENTKDFPAPHKYTKIVTARQLLAVLDR